MRRFFPVVVTCVLMTAMFPAANVGVAAGSTKQRALPSSVGITPPIGDWGMCTSAIQVGCIESMEIEHDDGQMRPLPLRSQPVPGEPFLAVSCVASPSLPGQCTGSESDIQGSSTSQCGVGLPATLRILARWESKPLRAYRVIVRTGSFEPALAWGSGITSTSYSDTDSGNHVFTLEGFTDARQMVRFPSTLTDPAPSAVYRERLLTFLSTAVADHLWETQQVVVYPPSSLRVPIPQTPMNTAGGCLDVPAHGIWAEANAQVFSYGMSWNQIDGLTNVKFNFEARGPHYQVGTSPAEERLVPARIRMFLPGRYLNWLGHTVDTLDINALKVSTSDGQAATPSVEALGDGVVVDFGIKHYSAPDPTLEIFKRGWAGLKIGTSVSTESLVRRAKLTRPRGSRVTVTVDRKSTRMCRGTSRGVKAVRTGTCRVKVTVARKGAKPVSRIVVISVQR